MVAAFPRHPDVLAITTTLLGQQQPMPGQQRQQHQQQITLLPTLQPF
jgi:hypothetical protein